MSIIDITDDSGAVVEPEWLLLAEPVHRELRPMLPGNYTEEMHAVFAAGGRMCIAADETTVVGLAVYCAFGDTFNGRKLCIDDLVTTVTRRSSGFGALLMRTLEGHARRLRRPRLVPDSGTQRVMRTASTTEWASP